MCGESKIDLTKLRLVHLRNGCLKDVNRGGQRSHINHAGSQINN